MIDLIRAEEIKGRRSLSRYSLILLPLLLAVIAIFLMHGALSQLAIYNFWYAAFLPALVAFLSINLINCDKRIGFINLSTLPISSQKIWLAKVITGWLYLVLANAILFGVATTSGIFFGSQFSISDGLLAGLVLAITWLWQIPVGMWLVTTFNSNITFLSLFIVNILCMGQDIAGGNLWFIPFAIPSRLMAPIIGINPNGVPLSIDSPLWNRNVIIPGIAITLFLASLTTYVTSKKIDWRKDK